MISPARLYFTKQLPRDMDLSNSILIYDSVLQKKYSKWIKKFPRRLGVKSGEKLKDLRNFHRSAEKILQLSEGVARTRLTIVAFGGGSVGDFAGFTASVLKRGVRLVHVPSTWLAAMDSAHGGKTALNVGSVKNQIGSFYSAEKIYLVRDVLQHVPAKRVEEALGEFYKMAFIDGGKLWQLASRLVSYLASSTSSHPAESTADFLWKALPLIIRAKMKIVNIDPYELKK